MALSPKDEDELFELLSHGWDKQFSAEDLAKLEAFVRKHGEPACERLEVNRIFGNGGTF